MDLSPALVAPVGLLRLIGVRQEARTLLAGVQIIPAATFLVVVPVDREATNATTVVVQSDQFLRARVEGILPPILLVA